MNQIAYILALDKGTTSSRAIVFDKSGSIISVARPVRGAGAWTET